MKNIFLLLITTFFLSGSIIADENKTQKLTDNPKSDESVILVSTSALADLAGQWIHAFTNSTNIPVKLELSDIHANSNITENSEGANRLYLDTKKPANTEDLTINVVGHFAAVPLMHRNNPFREMIQKMGISQDAFQRSATQQNIDWNAVFPGTKGGQMNIYVLSDEASQELASRFTGIAREKLQVEESLEDLYNALVNDPMAIAFISPYLLNKDQGLPQNLEFMPIDKNGNGRLDSFEDIYGNTQDLLRGIWIGKFPHSLINNLYLAFENPNDLEKSLINYIQQDGQDVLALNGFEQISSTETDQNTAYTAGLPAAVTLSNARSEDAGIWVFGMIALIGVIAAGILIWIITGTYRLTRKSDVVRTTPALKITPMKPEDVTFKKGLLYDKSHTWTFMQEDGNVKIGIDDFMQNITGKLTKVILRNNNTMVKKGEKFVTIIQDGKRLELKAPISGIIKQYNELLIVKPDAVNLSPYEKGWLYIIEPQNWEKDSTLMLRGAAYMKWIDTEMLRLKEFLTNIFRQDVTTLQHVVLQDGGEIARYPLENMNPEGWADFQSQFIEKSY